MSSTKPQPTDATKQDETTIVSYVLTLVLGGVCACAIVLGFALLGGFIFHVVDKPDSRHLTSNQKDDALNGIYEVDRIELADDSDKPLRFLGPVQFLAGFDLARGANNIDGNKTLEISSTVTTTINEVVARSVQLPPSGTSTDVTTIETLLSELLVFCETQSVSVLENLLQQITTFIDSVDFVVDGYATRYDTYYADYLARNTTFWDNEDRIAGFNVTCNNTDALAFISLYNATENRLQLLVDAHQVNVLNYTAQLVRYDNISATVNVQLGTNCSALLELQALLLQLVTDYNATTVNFAAVEAACDDCAGALRNATVLFQLLTMYDDTLVSGVVTLFNETAEVGANTTALLAAANATLVRAQQITSDATALVAEYATLNTTAATLQSNITSLRDLALLLASNYTQLASDVTLLEADITTANNIVQETVTNCTATNATLILQLISDFEQLTLNVTTTRSIVLGTLANTTRLDDLNDLEQRLSAIEATIISFTSVYDAVILDYETLNTTLSLLQGQYSSLVTEYTNEVTRLTTLQNELVALQDDFTDLQNALALIQDTLTNNTATISDHETRIVALEPGFACTLANSPNALVINQGLAAQNHLPGHPMTVAPSETSTTIRFTEARGVKFQDSRTLFNYIASSNFAREFRSTVGYNSAVDNSDFVYSFVTFQWEWDAGVAQIISYLGYSLSFDGPNDFCAVSKTSPTFDAAWVAYINGNADVECGDLQYDRTTDTVWLTIVYSYASATPGGSYTLNIYGADSDTVPQLTIERSDLYGSYQDSALLQISRAGRWLHIETMEHQKLPAPATPVASNDKGFIDRLVINRSGTLCASVYMNAGLGDFVYRNQSLVLFPEATITSAPNDTLATEGMFCYNTVTRQVIAANTITDAPVHSPAVSQYLTFDRGNNLFFIMVLELPTPGFTNVTLADGVTLVQLQSQGVENEIFVVARVDVASCRAVWAKQWMIPNNVTRLVLATTQPKIVATENNLMVMVRRDQTLVGGYNITYDANFVIEIPSTGNVVQLFRSIVIEIEKTTGAAKRSEWINALLRPSNSLTYDERTDQVHMFDAFGGTTLGYRYRDESFRQTTQSTVSGFLRFDGTILKLGHFTPIRSDTSAMRIAVNSHGMVFAVQQGGKSERMTFTNLAISNNLVYGMFQELDLNFAGDDREVRLICFYQEDQWPLGIQRIAAGSVDQVEITMRGTMLIGDGYFGAEDVGAVYHNDLSSGAGATMTRTRVGEHAQMGIKTITPDMFLVDIHTTPLIGSDQ